MQQGIFLPVNFQCQYDRPHVQYLHASLSLCMLKIPNTGSQTVVWTHKNTTHTNTAIGMGSAVLAAAVPYAGMLTRISCKTQRSTTIKIK